MVHPSQIPVVVVVTFPVSGSMPEAVLRELLEQTGPRYTNIPGLRRKYFLSGENSGGGVYEWESRALAEQFYDQPWLDRMREQTGAKPTVQFFDSPAIADGINHELMIYVEKD
ncbi:MAG: monooxygenase [Pseudomonadota bacterium]